MSEPDVTRPSTGSPGPDPRPGWAASDIPGRVRVRIASGRGEGAFVTALANRLQGQRGVMSAAANPLARSVTVRYDPAVLAPDSVPALLAAAGLRIERRESHPPRKMRVPWLRRAPGQAGRRGQRRGLWRVLDDVLVIAKPFLEAPDVPEGDEGGKPRGFAQAVQDIEDRIFLATGKRVRLAIVGPVIVVAIGLAHVALFGLMIDAIPGILLIWIGLDTFVKLNPDLVYGARLEQRVVDILSLADQERQIVTWVMRNNLATAEDVASHTGLDELAVRAHLRKLVEEGYLVEVGGEGETRYRAASGPKRASALSPEIWQKLDAGEGGSPRPRRRPSQLPENL